MILKRLFEKYHIEISPIILKEYKRIGLSKNEAWVLVGLITHINKNNTLSLSALASNLDMDENKVGQVLEKLSSKKFYTIDLIKEDNEKVKEIFNLEFTFKIIEDLITNDSIEENIKQANSDIKKTILEIEKTFKRPLTTKELSKIKVWFANDEYALEEIKKGLLTLSERRNFSFIALENYLRGLKIENETNNDTDKTTEERLKKIFDNI